MRTLNLGILAHVDAGKTTLTERLLYAAGAISELGNVDAGTTQTDTLALERQRGITIKTGVASFTVGDVNVNLIDTPGHPDFIAEVERALTVLDGAVLVVSAVAGVQAQTRVLFRALERLGVPTVFFVNKMDQPGADPDRTLASIASRLGAATDGRVVLGSALTGDGVDSLTTMVVDRLTPPSQPSDAPLAGRVFKIDRGPRGEKVAYVRLFSGRLQVRDRVRVGAEDAKVTGITVFTDAGSVTSSTASAGEIAKVRGLSPARVGDAVGDTTAVPPRPPFAPPTTEAVVVPARPDDRGRLRVALAELAEQDPLINARVDEQEHEVVVSLYGEVQKEVIQATLAQDYGIDARFRETTTVCVERPRRQGDAVALLWSEDHPYSATVGLRVDPGPPGSGVVFGFDADPRTIPLHIYKTREQFIAHMHDYVRRALRRGHFGWEVTDCIVTMTRCGFYASDGRRKPISPTSRTSATDFQELTPLVVRQALDRAGTVVCEPVLDVTVEAPADAIGGLMVLLSKLGAVAKAPIVRGDLATIEVRATHTSTRQIAKQLPPLTNGEGALETSFAGYRPIDDHPPRRT